MIPALWPPEVETRVRAAGRDLDPQRPPAETRMCERCVVTNQRPRITFDAEGVCSACRYAERKWSQGFDWAARAGELDILFAKHRRPDRHDVVVPCSGGKDSAAVAWKLKHEYGMHPLCAVWAPFMYSEVGWRNLQGFIHSGFDVVMAQPNGLIHRKLARLALEFYGDPFQPFVYGQLCWPMHVAAQNGIPLVFFGENGEAEYGGDMSAADKPCWAFEDWDRVYSKGAGVDRLFGLGADLGVFSPAEISGASPFYRLPEGPKPEFHWFSYYKLWHPMENFYLASERTGFVPNEERSEGTYTKFASIDDKLDGLHYYFAYLKFGIGRCTSDAAQQVRNGDITRAEALALVRRYGGEFPRKHLPECLEYLGLDRAHLDTVIARFNHAQVPVDRAA